MVQFYIIDNINTKWLKGDTYKTIVLLDHRHIFFGIKCFEEQLEYFGKEGMSILGSMEV